MNKERRGKFYGMIEESRAPPLEANEISEPLREKDVNV